MPNSATFPLALGGDGSTVTDDGNSATGLDNGGHRTRFVPALGQMLAVAQFVTNLSTNVYSAPGTNATSTTSLTVAPGAQSLVVQTGKSLFAGQAVVVAYSAVPSTQMIGTITSYNSATGALVVNVTGTSGTGTQAEWTVSLTGTAGAALVQRMAPVGAMTLTAADNGKLVQASGTWTLGFSSLVNGFACWVQNIGTGTVTIAASDGLTNWPMYPGEARLFQYDGTTLRSIVLTPFYLKTVTLLNYVHPPGYAAIGYDLVGGGGGGGSGRRGAAGSLRVGGAPGGAPARVRGTVFRLVASTAVTVAVGSGGAASLFIDADNTNGANGGSGGNTSFGTYATAYGGIGGVGGTSTAQGATSGSGSMGAGVSAVTAAQGGLPSSGGFGGVTFGNLNNFGQGGAGALGGSSNDGGNSEWGGAASGTINAAGTAISKGGSSVYGVPGGGVGGSLTAANVPVNGGEAGTRNFYAAGGLAGGTSGAAPTAGTAGAAAATDNDVGASGSGGGSNAAGNVLAGGAGGLPGGAGGGGGAVVNGFLSGAGGAGAAGRAIIWGVA